MSRLREAISEEFSELPLIIVGNKIDLYLGILDFSTKSKIKTFTEKNFVITTMNFRIFQMRVQTTYHLVLNVEIKIISKSSFYRK